MDLQVARLTNFYAHAADPLARTLFGEVMASRAAGYGPDYPSWYLPADVTDFIGTHHVFYRRVEGRIEAIGAFKHVALSACAERRLSTPLLDLPRAVGARVHEEVLRESLLDDERRGRSVVYSGSFVLRKELRGDLRLKVRFLELFAGVLALELEERRFDVLYCFGQQGKTISLFTRLGCEPVGCAGLPLDSIPHPADPSIQQTAFVLRAASPWAQGCLEANRQLLQQRLVVG